MEKSCIPTKLRSELKELGVLSCYPCHKCGDDLIVLNHDTDNAIREMVAIMVKDAGCVTSMCCRDSTVNVPSSESQSAMLLTRTIVFHVRAP